MCRGDTALTTFKWEGTQSRPVTVFKTEHQCVDWERLISWSNERAVTSDVVQGMKNPNL